MSRSWPEMMREKAQGSTDAPFWREAAAEMERSGRYAEGLKGAIRYASAAIGPAAVVLKDMGAKDTAASLWTAQYKLEEAFAAPLRWGVPA